jgi:hypothetical protein
MDTERLLKVLKDVQAIESKSSISESLSSIQTYIAQNDTAGYEQLQLVKAKLDKVLEQSVTNTYTVTDSQILEHIGGTKFVGVGAKRNLTEILNENRLNVVTTFTAYAQEYTTFTQLVNTLISNLELANFVAYQNENFEVSFIVPSELNNLQQLSTYLSRWERFLETLLEIADSEDKTVRLTRLNNGSLEFFVQEGETVIRLLNHVLTNIAKLYIEVLGIEKMRQDIVGKKLSNEQKMLKLLEEDLNKKKEEFVEETSKDIFKNTKHIPSDKKPELKSIFSNLLKVVLSYIQVGIKIEVSPPSATDTNADTSESGQALFKETVAGVIGTTQELRQLYENDSAQRKLPFSLDIDEELLEKDEKNRSNPDEAD